MAQMHQNGWVSLREKLKLSSLEDAKAALSRFPHDAGRRSERRALTETRRPRALKPHIGIIGAGVAGLRCAKVLSEHFSVTVLEARDRVGGRVQQTLHAGHFLDLGPNWIHGTENNPIYDIAQMLKLQYYEPPAEDGLNSLVIDDYGRRVDPEIANVLSQTVWDIIDEAIKYSKEGSATIPPEVSLKDYVKLALEARGYDKQVTRVILQMSEIWSAIVGEPYSRQSLRYLWLEESPEGDNPFLASTYQPILDQIYHEAKDKATIHLGAEVEQIVYDPGSELEAPVHVRTRNGNQYEFTEVVVTCPLGWLKRHEDAFSPPLPQFMRDSIRNIGFGRLEKIYITFGSAFWEERSKAHGRPFHIEFLAPNYAPETNPSNWTITCISMAALPKGCSHSTLLFYVQGDCSAHVTSLARGLDRASLAHFSALDEFFKPYYSRLPGFCEGRDAPSSIVSTDWQDDKYTNGSYSTFQVSDYERDGLVELDKGLDNLRNGLPANHLWFAGEHTAPVLALGTVGGAYRSGEAVADRILSIYC